jgi:hypothetical protein
VLALDVDRKGTAGQQLTAEVVVVIRAQSENLGRFAPSPQDSCCHPAASTSCARSSARLLLAA